MIKILAVSYLYGLGEIRDGGGEKNEIRVGVDDPKNAQNSDAVHARQVAILFFGDFQNFLTVAEDGEGEEDVVGGLCRIKTKLIN